MRRYLDECVCVCVCVCVCMCVCVCIWTQRHKTEKEKYYLFIYEVITWEIFYERAANQVVTCVCIWTQRHKTYTGRSEAIHPFQGCIHSVALT